MPQRLVIVSALKDELAALKKAVRVKCIHHTAGLSVTQLELDSDKEVFLFATGIGAKKTESNLRKFLEQYPVDAVFGTGYAGALIPEFKPGSLILADEIISAHGPARLTSESLRKECRSLLDQSHGDLEGRLVTVRKALTTPTEKEDAHEQYSAVAVDMESAALAKVCQDQMIPFVVLRAILDSVAMEVPDPEELMADDRPDALKVIKGIFQKPKRLLELPQLAFNARQARGRIGDVLSKLII